ncbi:MAG: hypothetical protein ACR2LC_13150 [Pyrinomonadaceae bacterium]
MTATPLRLARTLFKAGFEPDRFRFALQRVATRVPPSLEKRVG